MGLPEIRRRWNNEADEYNQWDTLCVEEIYDLTVQSCAASPFTYRTDTGDEHGKVVEDAELPERDIHENHFFLLWFDDDNSSPFELAKLRANIWIYNPGSIENVTKNQVADITWLRKHLIAWAEIRGQGMNYRIVYDVIKEEVLPAAWDESKQEFCKERTVMQTLGNARIEWCGKEATNENNNRS